MIDLIANLRMTEYKSIDSPFRTLKATSSTSGVIVACTIASCFSVEARENEGDISLFRLEYSSTLEKVNKLPWLEEKAS